MVVEQVITGGDRNFGYVIADETTADAALVDPSYDPDRLVRLAAERGWRVRYVLVTHDDGDHTNGNDRAKELTGAEVVSHRLARCPADRRVDDGDSIALGGLAIRAIHTPGHNASHVCYVVGDAAFTGDTLFVGKIGGTGSEAAAREEYASLHDRLLRLPDDTRVFPGHDVGARPTSTIGEERRTNPFLLQPSFKDFLHLKLNWADYKRRHGIP